MLNIDGRVAAITGAGSGMGRAAALLFARYGASIVCADVDAAAADATAQAIACEGGFAFATHTDVSRADDVQAMVAAAEQQFGGLDVLYNNAGLWLYGADGYVEGETDGPCPVLTEEIWTRTIDVSLKGTYLGCRYGIPALRRRGGGSIINVSSIAAFRVGSGASDAYTAAKGGVLAMTRSLAVEHAPDGIRVNCVVPGPIETPLVSRIEPERRRAFSALIPLGRWGTAEDVANMALFLAGDASSFCTGQAYVVDGGYLAV